jgi:hypothetical protein
MPLHAESRPYEGGTQERALQTFKASRQFHQNVLE